MTRLWRRRDEEMRQRRYAEMPGNLVAPPPPSPYGRATIRLTVCVDVEAWAKTHGKTVEDAERELHRRISDATSPMLGKLAAELGDMGDLFLSATASTS